jgi:hypothetical protein
MKLINGNGDVVATIEDVLKRAKAGEITGVVFATLAGNMLGGGWAIHDDEPHGWARLLAATTDLQHTLLTSDIEGGPA